MKNYVLHVKNVCLLCYTSTVTVKFWLPKHCPATHRVNTTLLFILAPALCTSCACWHSALSGQLCLRVHMHWRRCVNLAGKDCTYCNVADDVAGGLGVPEGSHESSGRFLLMNPPPPVFVEASEPQSRICCCTLQQECQQVVTVHVRDLHLQACIYLSLPF